MFPIREYLGTYTVIKSEEIFIGQRNLPKRVCYILASTLKKGDGETEKAVFCPQTEATTISEKIMILLRRGKQLVLGVSRMSRFRGWLFLRLWAEEDRESRKMYYQYYGSEVRWTKAAVLHVLYSIYQQNLVLVYVDSQRSYRKKNIC